MTFKKVAVWNEDKTSIDFFGEFMEFQTAPTPSSAGRMAVRAIVIKEDGFLCAISPSQIQFLKDENECTTTNHDR